LAQELRSGAALGNYKSALQERPASGSGPYSIYKVKSESGPDHHNAFSSRFDLSGFRVSRAKALARGIGSTKKDAEQDAARRGTCPVDGSRGQQRRLDRSKGGAGEAMSLSGSDRGFPKETGGALAIASAHRAGGICFVLRTVVVALFLLTFCGFSHFHSIGSMEHTLLVGDFLLVNKQIFAPASSRQGLIHWLMPYRDVRARNIAVFHHPDPPYLVKRVVGIPGDRNPH